MCAPVRTSARKARVWWRGEGISYPGFSAQQRWMTQDEAIAEIARRLVDYFHPERVYLLGSAARGDGGPDSDLDFCVVLPDEAPESLYRPGIHKALWGVGTAADVVRWPASDFDMRARHVRASLPATIVREGKVLYDARTVAA
jgi:predicted nucleotidyltransferase